jgi:AcrR family transcriptional regulator
MTKEVQSTSPSASPAQPPAPVRERLLDAAFRAFVEHGYAGASTLEIATSAKVSKRDLYALFGNKQALLEAGLRERTDRMRAPLQLPNVTDRASLIETLRAYGRLVLIGVTAPGPLAMYRLAVAEATRSPELAATLDRVGREANLCALTAMLKQAQQLGLVGAGDPAEMATHFSALLWLDLLPRLLMRLAEPPSSEEIERRARVATDMLLKHHPPNEVRAE